MYCIVQDKRQHICGRPQKPDTVFNELAHYRSKANPWSTKYSSGDDIGCCGIGVHRNLDSSHGIALYTGQAIEAKPKARLNLVNRRILALFLIHILLFHQRIYPIGLSPSALVCRVT